MAKRESRKLREILIPALGGAVLLVLAGLYLGQRYAWQLWDFKGQAKTLVRDLVQAPQTREWYYDKAEFGLQVSDPDSANGYLLAAGYFMDDESDSIRLIDVKSGKILKKWTPDTYEYHERAGKSLMSGIRFAPTNPLPMADGGLVFIADGYGPLVRVDACSKIVWVADGDFNHSLNFDLDGNLIVPVFGPPLKKPFDLFVNDYVARVGLDGKRIETVSVPQMLLDSGLGSILSIPHQFFGDGNRPNDGAHLNDVEVAREDGPYWKRGDWLLSLRNLNMVMIWRPETRKIVWHQIGPWHKQHDGDFRTDGTISVFGNDVVERPDGPAFVHGNSDIYMIAPDGKTVTTPYSRVMREERVSTETQGLLDVLPSGDAWVEESDHGRIVFLDTKGVKWRFNNTDGERSGQLYWSRYYPESELPEGILRKCGQ